MTKQEYLQDRNVLLTTGQLNTRLVKYVCLEYERSEEEFVKVAQRDSINNLLFHLDAHFKVTLIKDKEGKIISVF